MTNSIFLTGVAGKVNGEDFILDVDDSYGDMQRTLKVRVNGGGEGIAAGSHVVVLGRLAAPCCFRHGDTPRALNTVSAVTVAATEPESTVNGGSVNTVVVCGRLGSDPERREHKGKTVAHFDIAVDTPNGSSNGDGPLWVRVSAFNGTAQAILAHKRKGDEVTVTGSLDQAWAWTDRAGNDRATLQVRGVQVTFHGRSREGGNGNGSNNRNGDRTPSYVPDDEEIPW